MSWILIYFALGIIWAINATHKQIKYFGVNWKLPVTILLNLVFWPIGIFFAFINRDKYGG